MKSSSLFIYNLSKFFCVYEKPYDVDNFVLLKGYKNIF